VASVGTITSVSTAIELGVPFRWDLLIPERLGALLDGVPPPDL
jgi:hypothetical protein